MEPEEHSFHPDQVDAQIDRSPDQEMVQSLHTLYAAEAREMVRALERGRARLAQSQAAFAVQQEPDPAGPLSLVSPERQNITELLSRPPRRVHRWSLRLSSLVAAVLLFVLVGGLVAGLVLVRYHPTATTLKATPTAQASATGTNTSSQVNVYLTSVFDGTVVKVDTKTRAVLWTYKWLTQKSGAAGFGPLVLGDGSVYFAAGEEAADQNEVVESLYALDAQTGLLRWRQQQPANPYPVLVGKGVVYVTAGANLYALNASNGSERWHVMVGNNADDLVLGNDVLYGTTFEIIGNQWSSTLFAINPDTGMLLWQTSLPADKSFGVSVVGNGTLYLTSVEQKYKTVGALGAPGPLLVSRPMSDGKPKISYVYAYSQDGKQLWQSQKFDGYLGKLTVVGGVVYFAGDTSIDTLDTKNGKLLWQYQVAQGAVMYGSPIIANGAAYLESGPLDSGSSIDTYLIALNANDGTLHWKQKVDARFGWDVGMCVLANGLLYLVVGDFGVQPSSNLEAFSPADGSLVWKMVLPGDFNFQIFAAP